MEAMSDLTSPYGWHNYHCQQPYQNLHNPTTSNPSSVPNQSTSNDWWHDPLVEAIEQIPLHEKTGYMGALQKCPLDVRMREANPAVFIDFEGKNTWAAAKRLVKYWEWRVLLYGETLAYESILDIAGSHGKETSEISHLTEDDRMRNEISCLIDDQGMMVLPKTDSEGNFILFIERERFHTTVESDTQSSVMNYLRILLFNCTVIINRINNYISNPLFQKSRRLTGNYVIVSVYCKTPQNTESVMPNFRDMLENAIPSRLLRLHLMFSPKATSQAWKWLIRNVAQVVFAGVNNYAQTMTLVLAHVSDKKTDLIEHLLPYGIKHDMIPTHIGGTLQDSETNAFASSNSDTICDVADFDQAVDDELLNFAIGDTDFFQSQNVPQLPSPESTWWNDMIETSMEQLTLEEKHCYQSALKNCDLTIRNNEANPFVFASYAGVNSAKKLAKYWSWRVLLFGNALAYRSILHTTRINGQSTPGVTNSWNEFCSLVESETITVIPKVDVEGNFAIVYDRSHFPPGYGRNVTDSNAMLQLFLYSITNIIQTLGSIQNSFVHTGTNSTTNDDTSKADTMRSNDQTPSVILLNVIKLFPQQSYNVCDDICNMLLESLPTPLRRVHNIFVMADQVTNPKFVETEVSRSTLEARTFIENNVLVIPHVIRNNSEVVQQLTPYGITSDCLSQIIGDTSSSCMLQHPTEDAFKPIPYSPRNDLGNEIQGSRKELVTEEHKNLIVYPRVVDSVAVTGLPPQVQPSVSTEYNKSKTVQQSTVPRVEAAYHLQYPTAAASIEQPSSSGNHNAVTNSVVVRDSEYWKQRQRLAAIDYWRQKIPTTFTAKNGDQQSLKKDTDHHDATTNTSTETKVNGKKEESMKQRKKRKVVSN